jgi:hypothetical protein
MLRGELCPLLRARPSIAWALQKTTDDSPATNHQWFSPPTHDSVGVLLHLARQRFFDGVASAGHYHYPLALLLCYQNLAPYRIARFNGWQAEFRSAVALSGRRSLLKSLMTGRRLFRTVLASRKCCGSELLTASTSVFETFNESMNASSICVCGL